MKIKKGDKVKVKIGRDRGKEASVEKVFPKNESVLLTGINLVKRHRSKRVGQKGGIVEKPLPIKISKIKLICPKCGLETRVSYQNKEGEKLRLCKKCGTSI